MMRTLLGIVTIGLTLSPTASPMLAQVRDLDVSAGSAIVSPAVIATWIAHGTRTATPRVDILVLWRGKAGWFLKGDTVRDSSHGDLLGRTMVLVSRGGVDMHLLFDPRSRVAEVQGKVVRLEEGNVVLVDHVDSPRETAIIGTERVDPSVEGSPIRIQRVLSRSGTLVAFVRCDLRLDDPALQRQMDVLCSGLRPIGPQSL